MAPTRNSPCLYTEHQPLQPTTNHLFRRRMKSCNGAPKVERKTIEKNRRMHMKSLLLKLSSIVPDDHKFSSKDSLSQHDYLDKTASYIKHMKEKIQRLKQRKAMATGDRINNQERVSGVMLPMVEVRHRDSSLEVLLISEHNKGFVFHEVISVLEEEGAEVINASSSIAGDKVFHTIHCQELLSSIGLDASSVHERLEQLIA